MTRAALITTTLLLAATACQPRAGGPCRYETVQMICQAREPVTVLDDGVESGTVQLRVVYAGGFVSEEVTLSAPKAQEAELWAYIEANRQVSCEETQIVEGACVPGHLKLELPPRD